MIALTMVNSSVDHDPQFYLVAVDEHLHETRIPIGRKSLDCQWAYTYISHFPEKSNRRYSDLFYHHRTLQPDYIHKPSNFKGLNRHGILKKTYQEDWGALKLAALLHIKLKKLTD